MLSIFDVYSKTILPHLSQFSMSLLYFFPPTRWGSASKPLVRVSSQTVCGYHSWQWPLLDMAILCQWANMQTSLWLSAAISGLWQCLSSCFLLQWISKWITVIVRIFRRREVSVDFDKNIIENKNQGEKRRANQALHLEEMDGIQNWKRYFSELKGKNSN